MTALLTAADDYLRLRRSLGFQLTNQGRLLLDFVGFFDASGAKSITVAAALAWAQQPADADPVWLHARISVVRGFALYLQALDPATEVPPADLLPDGNHRAAPFIYTDEEITRLLQAAGRIRFVPRPTRRCSGCWRSQGCGSGKPLGSIAATSTGIRGCSQ